MEDTILVEDQKLNNDVMNIIADLKEELIFNFQPETIILTGSFGRGEATVFKSGSRLKFLSDCEIIILPNLYLFSRDGINKFCDNFYNKTGLEITIGGVLLNMYFFFPILAKRLKPTIGNFDLKYGSQVIYGFNFLDQIPNFRPEDIPVWEGIRLMINRMAEALEHFSIEEPDEAMFFWINKILLASQDALLILSNNYDASYRKRNELFKLVYPNKYHFLHQKYPNFLSLTICATEYKLGYICRYRENIIDFWFEVAEIVDVIFRYIINAEMGIDFDSYADFQKMYLSHPYIGMSYSTGRAPCHIYKNSFLIFKSFILGKKLITKDLILKINTPWDHIIYSSIPIIYFNLSIYCDKDKPSIQQLNNVLSWFGCAIDTGSTNSLDNIKRRFLRLWYQLCY